MVWTMSATTAAKATSKEQELRRHYLGLLKKHGAEKGHENFMEMFEENTLNGQIETEKLSIRRLFENFILDSKTLEPAGRQIVDTWRPGSGGKAISLMEAGDAITTGLFQNISGQLVVNTVMKAFMAEAFVMSGLVADVQTEFNGERVPGIGGMGDVAQVVDEMGLYPRAGLNEDWRDTPTTEKRGLIIALSREAVFFDRTGILIDQANKTGEWLGYNKELRLIQAFLDVTVTRHRYNWKGTQYATYQTSTPWINKKTSNGLTDWTNVDAAEQIAAAIRDSNTGAPIMNTLKHLVCGRGLLRSAERIINATEIEVATPGFATSGNPTQTKTKNPISNYQIVSSQLIQSKLTTATDWFLSDVGETIEYRQNFPLQTEPSPVTGEMWERDIAMQWKSSERGAAVVKEPRVSVMNTVA